jgi:hypothetical protein
VKKLCSLLALFFLFAGAAFAGVPSNSRMALFLENNREVYEKMLAGVYKHPGTCRNAIDILGEGQANMATNGYTVDRKQRIKDIAWYMAQSKKIDDYCGVSIWRTDVAGNFLNGAFDLYLKTGSVERLNIRVSRDKDSLTNTEGESVPVIRREKFKAPVDY